MSTDNKQTAPERTAMQIAIEKVKIRKEIYFRHQDAVREYECDSIITELNELLEKEKSQWIEAHLEGQRLELGFVDYEIPEDTFNQKYTNHDK